MQSRRSREPRSPLIVGLGGSAGQGSATDIALLSVLKGAELAGANTRFFGGRYLAGLPSCDPVATARTPQQAQFVEAMRAADGVVIATPVHHGGVSSLLTNALDLLQDLRDDARPDLRDRAVACVVTGAGAQSAAATLMALRGTIHALGGWPTPVGVTVDLSQVKFSLTGHCADPRVAAQLQTAGCQVVEFALARRLYADRISPGEWVAARA